MSHVLNKRSIFILFFARLGCFFFSVRRYDDRFIFALEFLAFFKVFVLLFYC